MKKNIFVKWLQRNSPWYGVLRYTKLVKAGKPRMTKALAKCLAEDTNNLWDHLVNYPAEYTDLLDAFCTESAYWHLGCFMCPLRKACIYRALHKITKRLTKIAQ